MERLKERLEVARKALLRLKEAVESADPSAIERDAGIHRFECAVEAMWKAAQRYLDIGVSPSLR